MKGKKRRILAWSRDDIQNLRRLAKMRMSTIETAKKLRRTPGAVAQKAMKLGVSFRSIGRTAGKRG